MAAALEAAALQAVALPASCTSQEADSQIASKGDDEVGDIQKEMEMKQPDKLNFMRRMRMTHLQKPRHLTEAERGAIAAMCGIAVVALIIFGGLVLSLMNGSNAAHTAEPIPAAIENTTATGGGR